MTARTVDAGEIRLSDVVRAELTKIRTLPVTWLCLAIAVTANTLLGVLAATDVMRVAGQAGEIPIARLGTVMLAPVYAFAAVAVFAAGGEYRTGQLRVSLAAVPDRNRFFLAKLLATSAVAAAAAVPVLLPGHLVRHLAAGGAPEAGAAATAFLAEVAAYLLLSLVGHGFAVLAKSVVTPPAVLVVLAVLASPTLGGVLPGAVRLLPHEATLSFLGTATDPALTLPRPAGLAVLLAWAVLSTGAAWAFIVRRNS